MKPINVEVLLGHNIGLSGAYYKPTEKQILDDYLNAIDFLTINEEFKLNKKIQEMNTKNKYNEYLIKGKLQEKDEQIKTMQDQIQTIMNTLTLLVDERSKGELAKRLIEVEMYVSK
jgi:hypothetical protein